MEKQIITFSANEQCLQKTGGIDCYASNIVSYIEAHFDLGANWSGYDSVRAVWSNDNNMTVISTVLDSNGVCVVPFEVLKTKGVVKVNLVGSISVSDVLTDRLTTFPCEAVKVTAKAKIEGSETQPITPSQFEQFAANVANDADRAEAGATASAQSAQSASESATASANSATSSAQSATASAQSAQNASEIAVEVEVMKNEVELVKDKVLGMRATAETLEAGSDATASYSDGLLTLGIPRGDRGEQGIQGETGATPNLTIGTVETLEPTEDATATITGTAENPVLNLGIPKGDTGEVSLEDLESLLPTDTASGDIVTITDGQNIVPAKSLKVALEPIQDLNGYDKPWSGGNGKNKFHVTATTKTSANVIMTVNSDGTVSLSGTADSLFNETLGTIELTAGTTYHLSGCPSGGGGSTYDLRVRDANYSVLVQEDGTGNPFTPTTSGTYYVAFVVRSGVNVSSKIVKPMICLESATNPNTFEPYSNICPISGHTECTTSVCGKNLFDSSQMLDAGTGAKLITLNLAPNTEYTMSSDDPCKNNDTITDLFFCNMDESVSSGTNGVKLGKPITRTTDSNGQLRVGYRCYEGWITPAQLASYRTQIEVGSSASDYVPFVAPTTHTTTLGRTVYGGTLDVVSGVLTVDRLVITRNTADMDNNEEYPGWKDVVFNEYFGNGQNVLVNEPLSIGELYGVNTVAAIGVIWLPIGTYGKTQSEWIVLAQDIQITIPLANPQTIQLTPQEVQLLLGTNNVWSDGDVTMTYNADIQRYIDKKLSGNSTTSMLSMSRPMVQTETTETEETETETAETE